MILDEIVERTRADLPTRKAALPLSELEARAKEWNRLDFAGALRNDGSEMRVIAELKRKTPSRGIICEDFRPVERAKAYEAGGAAALSILTDEPYFDGSVEHLAAVREIVNIPALRKDFIVDPYQVVEAAAYGADAILLIVATIDDNQLGELQDAAHALGLSALVEVNTESELERALQVDVDVLGINNRNLHTFEVTLETTVRLAALVPDEMPVVSLSGVFTWDDVCVVRDAGASAILVGESLMKSDDPVALLRELRCGGH